MNKSLNMFLTFLSMRISCTKKRKATSRTRKPHRLFLQVKRRPIQNRFQTIYMYFIRATYSYNIGHNSLYLRYRSDQIMANWPLVESRLQKMLSEEASGDDLARTLRIMASPTTESRLIPIYKNLLDKLQQGTLPFSSELSRNLIYGLLFCDSEEATEILEKLMIMPEYLRFSKVGDAFSSAISDLNLF